MVTASILVLSECWRQRADGNIVKLKDGKDFNTRGVFRNQSLFISWWGEVGGGGEGRGRGVRT